MCTYIKNSYIIIIALLLLTTIQQSFSQAKLVQTFIEKNVSGYTLFGTSVSGAGDLNNDGYDDLIVGAINYKYGVGRAYIFFGGNPMDSTADVVLTGEATGYTNNFGCSVSCAGDINNDGYDDVIVGADYYKSFKGRAYIYFGSNSMDSTADVIFTGKGSSDYFGCSVSGAGDVNNDGYDDVIVGAENYNSWLGRAYIYYGASSMDTIADVTLTGKSSNGYFGISVSGAGDINNDGYDDVVVGADYINAAAYIYFGGSPMDSTADATMKGTDVYYACSVSGAGDVNNDGYDDVIVGYYYYNTGTGRAYIYYGGKPMDTTADVIMTGEGMTNYFGYSVAKVGDINNDTYDDVIVGAYGFNTYSGRAYVYLGGNPMDPIADAIITGKAEYSRLGFSVSYAGDINNDGYHDVLIGADRCDSNKGSTYIYYGNSSIDTTADVTMTGETNNYFGASVSEAGDVNNDGYDDVIIGAPCYRINTGRAYIYYGGSIINNVPDVILSGEAGYGYFGMSVSGAGDLNNDGYGDVIVGAYNMNRAYIYFGGNPMDSAPDVILAGDAIVYPFGCSVSGAGDVNNDGYDDVIVGAYYCYSGMGGAYIYYGGNPMDSTADVKMTGELAGSYFGSFVSDAGDVNNDGYDDVIVGAPDFILNTGRIYVYYGGNPMDATADVIINGEGPDNYFGSSISNAGNVNHDSYDDIIVGAYGFNSNTGRTYIYYGGNPMDSMADIIINGEGSGNYFGSFVSNAGNVNNDSYDDIIVGACGFNFNTGHAYIYYGSNPMDTLADITLTGEGSSNYFGNSVSAAGDINNDSYPDIIVGAYLYPFDGKAYIYSDPSAPDAVETTISLNPDNFELLQNYPNPFNPSTTIEFSVGTYSHTSLRIYDIIGREVVTLVNGQMKPGVLHKVQFNASQLPSGIYFSCLESEGKILTKKLLLIK